MPDHVTLARTAPHTLSAQLCSDDRRLLAVLRSYGFAIADDAKSAVLDTDDMLLLPTARRLVADLRIAGLGVAADAPLNPSVAETETARRVATTKALARANNALSAWDALSDSLCDEHGWPLDDDVYGQRRAELDRTVWDAFRTFLVHGPTLLEQAHRALRHLTGPPEQDAQYALSRLRSSLIKGVIVHAEAQHVLAEFRDAGGTVTDADAYARALETRNSDGWHAAYEWMLHGETLVALAAAGAELPALPDPVPAVRRMTEPTSSPAALRSTGRH